MSLKKKLKKKGKNLPTDATNEDDENDIDLREAKLFRKEKVEFDDIVHKPPTLETQKLEKKIKEERKVCEF